MDDFSSAIATATEILTGRYFHVFVTDVFELCWRRNRHPIHLAVHAGADGMHRHGANSSPLFARGTPMRISLGRFRFMIAASVAGMALLTAGCTDTTTRDDVADARATLEQEQEETAEV